MLEKIKAASTQIKFCLIMPLIMAVLYLIAVADLDYGYYTFLRIISLIMLGIFVFVYYGATESFLNFPCIAAIFIAVLFNPIAPIYMSAEVWAILDVIAAVSMIFIAIYVLSKDVLRISSSAQTKELVYNVLITVFAIFILIGIILCFTIYDDFSILLIPVGIVGLLVLIYRFYTYKKARTSRTDSTLCSATLKQDLKNIRNQLYVLSFVYMLPIDDANLDAIVSSEDPFKEIEKYINLCQPSVSEFCLNMEKMYNIVISEFDIGEKTKDDIYSYLLSTILSDVSDDVISEMCQSFASGLPMQMSFLKNKINYQLAVLGCIMQYSLDTNNALLQNEVNRYRREYGYIE